MNQIPHCHELSSAGESLPYVLTKHVNGARHFFAVAECSLDGWGVFSDAFSEAFLECFGNKLQSTGHSTAASIGESARLAFGESLAGFAPRVREWVSGQFVASCISQESILLTWIGEMYAHIWNGGQLTWSNRPHVGTVQQSDGAGFPLVYKCFNASNSRRVESEPDFMEYQVLANPTLLFLGNRTATNLLSELEKLPAFQKLLISANPVEYEERIGSVMEFVTKWGRERDDIARGVLLYV